MTSANLTNNQMKILETIGKKIGVIIKEETDFQTEKDVYYVASEGNILTLSLKKLNLKKIPTEIIELRELISLNLTGNNFFDIQPAICKLKKLAILDLSYNNLNSINECITNLSLLRELRLNNNQLLMIPYSINKLINLRKLFLQGNQIRRLPQELAELQSLEEIHLDFRSTMPKFTKAVLASLEAKGCKIISDYNRR